VYGVCVYGVCVCVYGVCVCVCVCMVCVCLCVCVCRWVWSGAAITLCSHNEYVEEAGLQKIDVLCSQKAQYWVLNLA